MSKTIPHHLDTPRPPRRKSPRELAAIARRAKTKADWLGRDPAVVAADLARLDELLFHRARWRVASTMPENPHCYTRRLLWTWEGGDADFVFCATAIRALGDHEKFPPGPGPGHYYQVLHRRECIFWTMGWPMNFSDGRPLTRIINRKPPTMPGDQPL